MRPSVIRWKAPVYLVKERPLTGYRPYWHAYLGATPDSLGSYDLLKHHRITDLEEAKEKATHRLRHPAVEITPVFTVVSIGVKITPEPTKEPS